MHVADDRIVQYTNDTQLIRWESVKRPSFERNFILRFDAEECVQLFLEFILLPFMSERDSIESFYSAGDIFPTQVFIFGWKRYLAKKLQVWKPGHLMENTDPHAVYPATTNVCWWGFNIYGMFPQSNSFLIYTLWKSMLVTI